jgi:hypothetical protein
MLENETKKKELKERKKKKQACLDKPHKPRLISQTHNSLNSRLELNQEAKYPAN